MKAIVAVDLNWGIGFKGELLMRIPEDMKVFRELTLGKVIVMGRSTFESLPGKKPLANRVNIVLSKKESIGNNEILLRRSLAELFAELKKYNPDDVFIIGGESIYKQLLPFCTEAYVTKIEGSYVADKYFVNLNEEIGWRMLFDRSDKIHDKIRYRFQKYANTKIQRGEVFC